MRVAASPWMPGARAVQRSVDCAGHIPGRNPRVRLIAGAVTEERDFQRMVPVLCDGQQPARKESLTPEQSQQHGGAIVNTMGACSRAAAVYLSNCIARCRKRAERRCHCGQRAGRAWCWIHDHDEIRLGHQHG